MGGATLAAAAMPPARSWTATSYAAIVGANDRVRVALSAPAIEQQSLVPSFQEHAKELNFEFVAVSDIWNRRRDEGAAFIQKKCGGGSIASVRNNDELYARKDVDAVIVATADFQHALHGIEAVHAGRDAYVEKPTAHTMEDRGRSGPR